MGNPLLALYIAESPPFTLFTWAFIAKTPLQNYKNNIENNITMEVKREENQKSQKAKTRQQEGTVAGEVNSVAG